jgi:ribosomal protein S4
VETVEVADPRLNKLLVQAGLVPSATRADELIKSGAVSVDGETLRSPAHRLTPGRHQVRAGKKVRDVLVPA